MHEFPKVKIMNTAFPSPQKPKNERPPHLKKIIVVFAIIALSWIIFSPGSGIIALLHKKTRLKELAVQTEELSKENAELQQDIDKIQNDPASLEDLARRKYHMLKKDEIVYDFSRPPKEEEKK